MAECPRLLQIWHIRTVIASEMVVCIIFAVEMRVSVARWRRASYDRKRPRKEDKLISSIPPVWTVTKGSYCVSRPFRAIDYSSPSSKETPASRSSSAILVILATYSSGERSFLRKFAADISVAEFLILIECWKFLPRRPRLHGMSCALSPAVALKER